jgi:hypothetical protein
MAYPETWRETMMATFDSGWSGHSPGLTPNPYLRERRGRSPTASWRAHAHVTCPACCAPASFRQASWKWSAVECSGCGHCFTLEESEATSDNTHFENSGYVAWREQFRDDFEGEAAARATHIQGKIKGPGRLLEIGCSTGEFLHAMADKGWEAFGIDAMLLANGESASFDLIAAFHLIEHVRKLDELLENCRRLATPTGSLVIFTPHWDAWSRRLFGDNWPDFMPEHLHFFTARSLSLLLARHGFRVVHVATTGTSWSWLGGLWRTARLRRQSMDGGHGHPGRLKMTTLRAGNVLLSPLLRLEERLGSGTELRVVAQAA